MKNEDNNLFYTLAEIAKITNGTWKNITNKEFKINDFNHILRYLKKDDLFIFYYENWHNKKNDNENEIENVIKSGASSIMVQENSKINVDLPTLVVDDTYYAIRKLALYASEKSKSKRVLITGSYGKTAFKIHLYELIKSQINVYARLNSANQVVSTYGNLSSLKRDTEVILLEIPISSRNNTKRRASYVKPDICVLTSIGHEHIEIHKDIKTIIKRKCSIASTLSQNGKFIIPQDDKYYESISNELRCYNNIKVLTFGTNTSCNAQLLSAYFNNFSWEIKARIEDEIIEYSLPFIEVHAPLASLSELLCVYHLGLDIEEAIKRYSLCFNFKSSGILHKLKYKEKQFFLYDQSRRGGIEGYESFFKTMKNLKPSKGGKKILITSEFVDIKDNETKYINIEVFQDLIKKADIDEIYSVENFKVHEDVISDKSKWKGHYNNINILRKSIFKVINDGDIIFIKGIYESSIRELCSYIIKKSSN